MGSKLRILIVDDEQAIRKMLTLCLQNAGYEVAAADSAESALALAKRSPPHVALIDLRLGEMDGIAVTRALLQEVSAIAIIIMTAYATVESAILAMKAGASDYLIKPFTPDQVLHTVGKTLDQGRFQPELDETPRPSGRRGEIGFKSRSPVMQAALGLASRAAATDATVMLLGETGTGKSTLARHIHKSSARSQRPFVTVHCAVISPALVESELFGHKKGAFTGANQPHAGFVESAADGTLFLDEIGDLPLDLQGKLLRLLEEREYVRVGDTQLRHSQARIIAATHRDLKQAVKEGRFREDLYYRLHVLTIRMPPLRERPEDILELAQSITRNLSLRYRGSTLEMEPEFARILQGYGWPGNLRELVNVLERVVILAPDASLSPDLLPEELHEAKRRLPVSPLAEESLEAAERRHLMAVLARYPTLEAAAKALGIDPSTLYRKRERYGLL